MGGYHVDIKTSKRRNVQAHTKIQAPLLLPMMTIIIIMLSVEIAFEDRIFIFFYIFRVNMF